MCPETVPVEIHAVLVADAGGSNHMNNMKKQTSAQTALCESAA
jgi:hypothetical protein